MTDITTSGFLYHSASKG